MIKTKRHAELETCHPELVSGSPKNRFRNKFGMTIVAILSVFLFFGCDQLQDSLSTKQEEDLNEETGIASVAGKYWYYNGTSSSDMSSDTGLQSLRINFTKKVAVGESLNGKIILSYTDYNGSSVEKTITSLSGTLYNDSTSYALNMLPVAKFLYPDENPSGEAKMTVKIGGFVCAEGSQNGRTLEMLEAKNILIRPLYDSTSLSFSTQGFSTSTAYEVPLNSEITLEDGSYTVTGTDLSNAEYNFTVTASGSTVYLTPAFETAPEDGTVVTIPLTGIMPASGGTSYSKTITATFTKNLIVVDGKKDSNWTDSKVGAVYASDEEGDSVTDGYVGDSDLTGLYVVNDAENLYVAIEGSLKVEWYSGLAVLISKDHTFDASSAAGTGKEGYGFVDTASYGRTSLVHGMPDYYLFYQPHFSTLKAYVEKSGESAADVSSNAKASDLNASFVEFAIPMSDLTNAGISAGDTIHVIGAFSAHWDEGVFLSDAVPDAAITTINDSHSTATINFQNALGYTLK